MKLYLLLCALLVAQAWAGPTEAEDEVADNQVEEEDDGRYAQGGYGQLEDLCRDHPCPVGRVCDIDDDNGEPVCVCARSCPPELNERAKVCSTTNVTFESECELRRQKCLCQHKFEECQDRAFRNADMDYFGACRDMQECTEGQLSDFPERMRNWFYNVMEELAKRKELSKPAMKWAKKANKQPKRWVLPSIWKFCELDHSHDMFVSREELMAITALLKGMEPCTGPFVEKCDPDANGIISAKEWVNCLGLDEDEQDERVDRLCKDLTD